MCSRLAAHRVQLADCRMGTIGKLTLVRSCTNYIRLMWFLAKNMLLLATVLLLLLMELCYFGADEKELIMCSRKIFVI